MPDQAFARLSRRFLLGGRLPLLPQDIDRAFDIAFRFDQRRAAIGKSRAGSFAKFLHQLRGDIDRIGWICHGSMAFLYWRIL
jgi:hypothetical protein